MTQVSAARAAAPKAASASGGLSLTPVNPDGQPVTAQTPASPTLTPVTTAPAATAAAPAAASAGMSLAGCRC